MIRSDEEFEDALERVARWLEQPPAPESAEEECFHRLLCDIDLYRPRLEAADDTTEPPERAELRRRAEALSARFAERGPTLMGVLNGAVRASMGRHP